MAEVIFDFGASYFVASFIVAPASLPMKNESWLKSNGKPNYPPNNGAVLGTEVNKTLEVGTKLGRYGDLNPKSNFVTDTISTITELSLPPWTDPVKYQEFTVIKPIDNVITSEIEAWAQSLGGGTQYVLPRPIIQLIQEGFIQ